MGLGAREVAVTVETQTDPLFTLTCILKQNNIPKWVTASPLLLLYKLTLLQVQHFAHHLPTILF